MKKRVIILLLLCFFIMSSTALATNWVLVERFSDKNSAIVIWNEGVPSTYYIDSESVVNNAGTVVFWQKEEFDKPVCIFR